jgi:hypothetical protein
MERAHCAGLDPAILKEEKFSQDRWIAWSADKFT